MLNEYKDTKIWKENIDGINLRSDILVSERVIDLLGNVKDKKILDLGCGNGKVSRILSKNGAKVYGVDKTEEQLSIARESESKVVYFLGDITNLNEIDLPKDFDIIISLMTFLYLDEKQIIETLLQIKKHIKKDGVFIYANIHPSRYKENEKVEDEIPTTSGDVLKTVFYNHSSSFIKKAFNDTGFSIKNIIEPTPTSDEIKEYKILFSDNLNKPQYLIIETVSL